MLMVSPQNPLEAQIGAVSGNCKAAILLPKTGHRGKSWMHCSPYNAKLDIRMELPALA